MIGPFSASSVSDGSQSVCSDGRSRWGTHKRVAPMGADRLAYIGFTVSSVKETPEHALMESMDMDPGDQREFSAALSFQTFRIRLQ